MGAVEKKLNESVKIKNIRKCPNQTKKNVELIWWLFGNDLVNTWNLPSEYLGSRSCKYLESIWHKKKGQFVALFLIAMDAAILGEKISLISHCLAGTVSSYVDFSRTNQRFAGRAGQHYLK